MSTERCPPIEILSAWFDEELRDEPARDVEAHLDGCEICRDTVIEWLQLGGDIAAASAACLDGERLVAYADRTLCAEEAARAKLHLLVCPRCAREVREMRRGTVPLERGAVPLSELPARQVRRGRFAPLLRPGPALSAAAVAALVIVVVARLLPTDRAVTPSAVEAPPVSPDAEASLEQRPAPGAQRLHLEADREEEPVQPLEKRRGLAPAAPAEPERGIRAGDKPPAGAVPKEMAASPPAKLAKLTGRAGPNDAQPVVTMFMPEEIRGFRGADGEWTQVNLADGRNVWVRSLELSEAWAGTRALGFGAQAAH